MGVADVVSRAANRFLHRRDLHVTRWSLTARALRPELLGRLAVTEVVDVGANEGQYAAALREGGYRGRIVSVEPVASAFAALERAAAADPAWVCLRAALGGEPGEIDVNVAAATVFSSVLTMGATAAAVTARAAPVRTERVPLLTLDEVVERECGDGPLAVKIDTQGYEGQVLAGGAAALERAVAVELELSPVPVYEGELSMLELMSRMGAAGFTLALTENVWLDDVAPRFRQFNCLFVR